MSTNIDKEDTVPALTTEEIAEVTADNLGIWNRCAATYTDVFGPLTGAAADVLLDLAGVGQGTALIDIGTGPGTLIDPALKRGATITAIDLAPAMVEQARIRHPNLDIRVGDASTLPYPDGSFDAVTLGFCLHHTAHPTAVLNEAKRVLRPGGRVSFAVWAPADQLEAFGLAFTAIGESIAPAAAQTAQPPVIGSCPADYQRLLHDAGFVHATARTIDLSWDLVDGSTIFDGFDRYLDLANQPATTRDTIMQRLDQLINERRGSDGLAHLANPAIVAAAYAT